MRTKLMIAAAAALLAGAAYAQTGDTAVNPTTLPQGVATGNAGADVGANGQPSGTDVTAPSARSSAGFDASVAPASSSAERAPIASVDVVSNGPVPDTSENRARYGQPMSNAGRMTRPAGD